MLILISLHDESFIYILFLLLRCQRGYLGPSDAWSEFVDERLTLLSKSVTSLTLPPSLKLPATVCPWWDCLVVSLSNLFLLTCPVWGTVSHLQVNWRYGIPVDIPWQMKINIGEEEVLITFTAQMATQTLCTPIKHWQCAMGVWALSYGESCIPLFQEYFLIIYHSHDTTQTNVPINTVLSEMELGITHYQNIVCFVIFLLLLGFYIISFFFSLEFHVFTMFILHCLETWDSGLWSRKL